MIKIAVIHFQSIEKYPPVMNFINSITNEQNIDCNVYTLNNIENNWFASKNCQIFRIGNPNQIHIKRYWGYLQFNLVVLLKLFFSKPKIVIAFETYSLLPVFFYRFFFRKSKIFIHYHEYISTIEIKNSSKYYKLIYFFEKKLMLNCDFLSHTNTDRLKLFLIDNPTIGKLKTFVAPNLPPKNWYKLAKQNKKKNNNQIIKIVHVGAIGLNSMYIIEIINWVVSQSGKYCIDFYSNNISEDAKKIFENLDTKYVKLFGSINYFELPKVLIEYDIGVTLYNGHIPNYVYNVPNKVFEYLACGLNVWYSKELISTHKFVKQYDIKGCNEIDFLNIKINQDTALNEFNENSFFANTTNTLKEKISDIVKILNKKSY
jgi:hypothetical protein